MDLIDSTSQFTFEYISRTNPLMPNNVKIDDDSNKLSKKSINLSKVLPTSESNERNSLAIVGFELNRKSAPNLREFSERTMPMRNDDSKNLLAKGKLFRNNKISFKTEKRTNLRSEDTFLSRRAWTSNVSQLATTNKSPVVSSPSNSPSKQNLDDTASTMTTRRTVNSNSFNPSVTILKKIPSLNTENQLSPRLFKKTQSTVINTGRELSPVKLPSLLRKSSSTVIKQIPTAYIQESSQNSINTSNVLARPVLPTAQILPVYPSRRTISFLTDPNQLPAIRDHMVKVNLNQKATFKCKSPAPIRPDSSLSRSTAGGPSSSTHQLKAFNPLKYLDVGSMLGEAARHQLKRLFHQLDTDHDGHLTYPQVQKCLPSNLRRAQSTLFRVLYDLTTDATYFGLQEFYATAILVDMVSKQDSYLWDNLLDDVDFNHYRDDILEYLNDFDHYASSSMMSTINFEELVSMIQHRMLLMKKEQIVKVLENFLPSIRPMTWTRLEFIGFLPSLIYMESLVDPSRTLFRFRDNSILDCHMKNSVVI